MEKRYWLLIALLATFLTLTDAFAATYYVKPDGNDAAAGTSDATAWKTIAKVNSFNFQPGDDVYFKCGGTYLTNSNRLYIDWAGTSSDPATIGAYYMMNGKEVIGVNGKKPVITGTYWMGGPYFGFVEAAENTRYIAIENIRVENGTAYGIYIFRSPNAIIRNCETFYTYSSGIMVVFSENCLIQNNVVDEAVNANRTNESRQYYMSMWGGFPAALSIVRSSHNAIIENNTVRNSWGGECMGAYFNCDNVTFRNNIIYGIPKIGIYLSGNITNSTVESNLIYGTTNTNFMWWVQEGGKWVRFPGYGIAFDDEGAFSFEYRCEGMPPGDKRCRSRNNKAINNFIAYCHVAFQFGSSWEGVPIESYYIYNNTAVACRYGFQTWQGTSFVNFAFKNNLITCDSSTVCYNYSGPSNLTGVSFDYNIWPQTPSSPIAGPNDKVSSLNELSKNSSWTSLVGGDLSLRDFSLRSTSKAINAGITLGNTYARAIDCEASDQPGSNKLVIDDQNAHGNSWEIGACVYKESGKVKLAPPSSLSILTSQ